MNQEKNRSLTSAFIMNGDGSGRRDLGSGSEFPRAAVSPDQKRVAVVLTDASRGQSEAARLLVHDLTVNIEPVQVAVAPRLNLAAWSPDGSRVAYQQFSSGSSSSSTQEGALYIGDPAGQAKPVRLVDSLSSLVAWAGPVPPASR